LVTIVCLIDGRREVGVDIKLLSDLEDDRFVERSGVQLRRGGEAKVGRRVEVNRFGIIERSDRKVKISAPRMESRHVNEWDDSCSETS